MANPVHQAETVLGEELTVRPTAIAMPPFAAPAVPDVSWVIDHSDNAVVVCDDAAHITWINQGFTRMLGYTPVSYTHLTLPTTERV